MDEDDLNKNKKCHVMHDKQHTALTHNHWSLANSAESWSSNMADTNAAQEQPSDMKSQNSFYSDTPSQCDNLASVISDSSSSGVQGTSAINADITNQKMMSSKTSASHQCSGSSIACSNSQQHIAVSDHSTEKKDSAQTYNNNNNATTTSSVSNAKVLPTNDPCCDQLNSSGYGPRDNQKQCRATDASDKQASKSATHYQNKYQSSNGWDHIKPNSWNIPPILHLSGQISNSSTSQVVLHNQSISSSQKCSTNDNDDQPLTGLEALGATGGRSPSPEPMVMPKRQIPIRLGLLGGGESALASHNSSNPGWGSATAGSSGWGNMPQTSAPSGHWGSNSRHHHSGANSANSNPTSSSQSEASLNPAKPQNTWAQAAGKGLNLNNNNNNTSSSGGGGSGNNSTSVSQNQGIQGSTNNGASANNNKAVHDDDFRQAVSSHEGWGQTVNQDTSWDIPVSPEPSPKENGSSVWRSNVSNGTEIWEKYLHSGGKSIAPPQSQQPWGRNPTTNIGGTWGEEEDTSNMWIGVPGSGTSANGPNSWGNAPNNNTNNYWGGQQSGPPPPQPVDKAKQWGQMPPGTNQPPPGPAVPPGPPSSWNEQNRAPGPNLNGDNGTGSWACPPKRMEPPTPASWQGGPPPPRPLSKDNSNNGTGGWQEPSPPQQRRTSNQNSTDDGTSVWGNPGRQGKVCHWKDMPSTKGNNANMMPMQPGPGMIRLPPCNSGPNKDQDSWGKDAQGMRSNSWADSQNNASWADDMKGPPTPSTPNSASSWSGDSMNNSAQWGAKPKNASVGSWSDGQIDTSNWGTAMSKQGAKPLTKELIWASKQFRLLSEMGFKKDDVENSLRNNNMDMDETLAELQRDYGRERNLHMEMDNFGANLNSAIRSSAKLRTTNDDFCDPMGHSGLDVIPPNLHNASAQMFGAGAAPTGANQNYKPQVINQGNAGGGTGPAVIPPQPVRGVGNLTNNTAQQQNVPSATQLRHLVQQIQMAVQAGHLNPQILNQPLAPATLLLLNQLLQQLKVLQQLTTQQQICQAQQQIGGAKSNNPTPLQISVQITKTKQQIANLQNQIAAQQALYVKQQVATSGFQPPQQHLPPNMSPHQPGSAAGLAPQSNDPFMGNRPNQPASMPDTSIMPPQTDFQNMSLKDAQAPQSRLNQWKLPSLEKEEIVNFAPPPSASFGNTDFSRAPGSVSKPSTIAVSSAAPTSQSTPNLNPILGPGDGTWSSLARNDSGWPDSSSVTSNSSNPTQSASSSFADTNKESHWPSSSIASTTSDSGSSGAASTTYASLSDLVTEFEPGKPWKGGMKNIEDDPHMTPGSVARSPLSLTTIKDPADALFNISASTKPSPVGSSTIGLSLSSSTWSFSSSAAPSLSSASSSNRGKAYANNHQKNWPDNQSNYSSSEVWGNSTKNHPPPPGMNNQSKLWGQVGMNRNLSASNSTWLVLRNLTPQIDGSTLKTLCLQHGPLQLFHLNLHHGIALVCYSSREEAAKAQNALNNCVLGNTTILADFPTDAELQSYVHHASGGNWNGTTNTPPTTSAPGYRNIGGAAKYSGNAKTEKSSHWNSNSHNSAAAVGHPWSMASSAGGTGAGSGIWSAPSFIGAGASQAEHHDRSTPLNSFFLGDLLGGESV